jgi:glycosyltransferase involved in cell wall biosynthesis
MYVGMLQVGKEVWPLVLLGDGELRGELEALCGELGIKVFSFQGSVFSREKEGDLKLNSYKLKTSPRGGCVIFAGFRQIAELPAFYGSAGAFIHPALSEPWGLVINEAMASGLPILSSKNVGAAEELLIEGETGFLFDPMDLQAISAAMHQIATLPEDRRQQMGESARELVEKKAPLHGFGNGLKALLLQK